MTLRSRRPSEIPPHVALWRRALLRCGSLLLLLLVPLLARLVEGNQSVDDVSVLGCAHGTIRASMMSTSKRAPSW